VADNGAVLRFLTCGSVDDGKSTLIGHLLHLTGNIPSDQLELLAGESVRLGTTGGALDYSLLLDGLLAEREQGITIDVAYRYFAAAGRKFIVADTPGHDQYTRNMATGASQCAAALILVDVQRGIVPQTRRHALICALMGISQLLFVVNKMDRVDWAEAPFRALERQTAVLVQDLEQFGLRLASHALLPVSALHGDNLTALSASAPWYQGPTVLEWLAAAVPEARLDTAPLRFPVQCVLKAPRSGDAWQAGSDPALKGGAGGTFRAYAGTIVSGAVAVDDRVVILPGGTPSRIAGLWAGDRPVTSAAAGEAVAVVLDGDIDVGRGDLIAPLADRPEVADQFKARLIWMDETPLYAGRQYLFRGVAGTSTAEVTRVRNRIEPESYHRLAADALHKNDVAEVEILLSRPIPFDPYQENRETGAFVLIDRLTNATACCGMMVHALRRASNVHWQVEQVDRQARAASKGQQPAVIWLTGLSGSGKSTIANVLESRLHGTGQHTMLLDGDNVRHGLNKDLGFTEADRIENIRRIGEVAKLMTDAGLLVITAFISPFRADRDLVRALIPAGEFIEVYVNTPLAECERRDPKGLYRKARQGLIPNFTGINSPYEAPPSPELELDACQQTPEQCAEQIIRYLVEQGRL
jgi:bifunctional enzyme CysN/CysC